MKPLLTLLALSIGLASCSPDFKRESKNDYNVVTIEECEYIEVEFLAGVDAIGYYSITHKGNCKNKIHSR